MPSLSLQSHNAFFSEREACFLCDGGLGRLATVSPDGQPHVVPVAYEFDGEFLYFSGRSLSSSLKFRHITLNQKVAFVVDDVISLSPWHARGIEVRGDAEILDEGGRSYVRITPRSKASWGMCRED
jgi:pyridoxamine 5'-phosphate oxidase family protein